MYILEEPIIRSSWLNVKGLKTIRKDFLMLLGGNKIQELDLPRSIWYQIILAHGKPKRNLPAFLYLATLSLGVESKITKFLMSGRGYLALFV
jgi:hypothetical protein